MKKYSIDAIRNVAIVGHSGTGKTSVAESLLFVSGAITRVGRVDDGTSVSDFDADEIQRKISINSAVLPCEWNNTKINFLDTPGYPDFVGDILGCLRAVETAIIVVDGSGNVEVGTENGWELAEAAGVNKLFFVNKLEKENSNFYSTLDSLRDKFGTSVAPLQLPIGAEDKFEGVIDLLSLKAYKWDGGKVVPMDIPSDMADDIKNAREALIESVAEVDDALTEKYLDEGTLCDEDVAKGLAVGLKSGLVVPVLCGSAAKNVGIQSLLNFIVDELPSPADVESIEGTNKNGEIETRNADDTFCALVFKTLADPYVGKLTYFRVFSGAVKSDSHLYNVTRDKDERVGQVYFLRGKNQEATAEVCAGDIGAVAKLQDTETGDTLCDKTKPIVLKPLVFPEPVYTLAVKAKTKADEDKLGPALHKLSEEDPTFKIMRDPNTGQSLMSGMGDTHLDIVVERLKRKFGVAVETDTPKIAYRETIAAGASAQGRHKKQSGGRGQFGDCWVKFEPLPRGGGYEYVDAIVGGAIPRQFIPSVDKGIKEALTRGIQAGCPVVDIKATCYDGSYHPVDSSDMAFQLAGMLAFQAGTAKANPVILEPIMNLEIVVPDKYMGDVIGDLNTRRGRIGGMEPIGSGKQRIKAQAPQAEIQRYSIDLRSIAHGRGRFSAKFSHYEEMPAHNAQLVIAEYQKNKAKEEQVNK